MSQTLPIRLYGITTGSGIVSDLANVIIPRAGTLVGMNMTFAPSLSLATGDDILRMQVSMVSVEQLTVNDVSSVIGDIFASIVTQGTAVNQAFPSFSTFITLNLKIVAGVRIYLHVNASGSGDEYCANLYFEV